MTESSSEFAPARGIYRKINAVMKRVHGVAKDSENKHGKYKYAGHEAVTASLRDVFADVGIVRSVDVVDTTLLPGGVIQLLVAVRHTDIDDLSFVESRMPAVQPTQTAGGSYTAQQVGQALSYAQKVVEFKLFALTGDPEPDSDSTEANAPREQLAARQKDEQAETPKQREQAKESAKPPVKANSSETPKDLKEALNTARRNLGWSGKDVVTFIGKHFAGLAVADMTEAHKAQLLGMMEDLYAAKRDGESDGETK